MLKRLGNALKSVGNLWCVKKSCIHTYVVMYILLHLESHFLSLESQVSFVDLVSFLDLVLESHSLSLKCNLLSLKSHVLSLKCDHV